MKIFVLVCVLIVVKVGTTYSQQQYSYDSSGNVSSDGNKKITSIHYNYLNLADTIVYADGRRIIYTYTASGQKLSQRVLLANGTVKEKRDYVDGFQYRSDTLHEVQHDLGRLVPIVAGSNSTSWEYQYNLADHLGNVRSTITSQVTTRTYIATMESTNAEQEEGIFMGLVQRRITMPLANTTPGGEDVVGVINNTEEGVSMNLPVKNGDMVNLSVYATYLTITEGPAGGSGDNILLPMIMNALSGGIVGGGESSGILSSPAGGSLTAAALGGDSETVPVAHLNYVLLDKNNVPVDGGFAAVTEAGGTAPEQLQINSIKIRKTGVLHVYLSNTSAENNIVYFDDLRIDHTPTPVVQEDGYDPFGMVLAEQHDERFGEEKNRRLYNGKELQDDFDLNWSDYGARMYDAALGRWHVIDPFAEKHLAWSPYNYVLNNPVLNFDPDGRLERDSNGEIIIEEHGQLTPRIIMPEGDHVVYEEETISADDGTTKIQASKLIDGETTGDRDWRSNCHGTTFAGGKFWINGDQAEKVLVGDGYAQVDRKNTQAGDIVIFRNKDGHIEHSVTVIKVEKGKITVQGKDGSGPVTKDNVDGIKPYKNDKQIYYRKRAKSENKGGASKGDSKPENKTKPRYYDSIDELKSLK